MHHHNFVFNAAKALTLTLIFTTTLIILNTSPAAANPANSGSVEQQILDLNNAERAARGIRPLVSDGRLQQKAREWAQKLAQEGTIYHMDVLPARGFGFRAGGENIIYRSPSMTSNYAHIEWMLSDLHRKNMLDPAFSHAGVGVACATVGDRNFTVAVVEFGADSSPSTSVPPLNPRVVGGDPYAGTEVNCKGFAPLDLSPILSIVLPPPTQSGIAPASDPAPAPAPVVAKPKPKPAPIAAAPPVPAAPSAPAAPAVVIPDEPAVVAQIQPAPIEEPKKEEPAAPDRLPQLEPAAAVDAGNSAAIWSGALFIVALCSSIAIGLVSGSGRRTRAEGATAVRGVTTAVIAPSVAPKKVTQNNYSGRVSLLDLTGTPTAKRNSWRLKR